jgi:hypothetical protein
VPQASRPADNGRTDITPAAEAAQQRGAARQVKPAQVYTNAPVGGDASGPASYGTSAIDGPGNWAGSSSMAGRIAHRRMQRTLSKSPRDSGGGAIVRT